MNARRSWCETGLVAATVLASFVAHADPLPPPSPAAAAPFRVPLEEGQHFTLDPVVDGVITAAGFGFSGILELVLSTGEIRPPAPAVGEKSLLFFDRVAVTQTIDPNAATYSDIGLASAIGFAVLDPILSGFRDGTDALLVDGLMYAESGAITLTLADLTKIAVRRPRPIDYKNCEPAANGAPSTNPGCTSTDLGLSFYSGHAAGVSAIGATATYLAFVRSPPHSPRPWITLGVATVLAAFVSYERVRAGMHFPSDVVAGSLAGASVGILVPHLHRHMQEAPPVWVGVASLPGGGSLTLNGRF